MKKNLLPVFLFSFFLLTGCATTSYDHPLSEASSLTTAECVNTIALSGRFSMLYTQNDKPEAVHGKFIWNQAPEQTSISLLSPLNQIIAEIKISPNEATLISAGQPVRHAKNVDTLIANELGWPLPVSGLLTWLQGCGMDTESNIFMSTPNANTFTTQDGWQIHYVNWQEDESAKLHPKRIDLRRSKDNLATTTVDDISLRLVIDTRQR